MTRATRQKLKQLYPHVTPARSGVVALIFSVLNRVPQVDGESVSSFRGEIGGAACCYPQPNLRHTISADGHDQATGRVPPRPQVTLHLWAKVEQETIRRRNARRSQATTRFLCWDKATKSIPTAEKIGMRQHHLEMIHKLCKLI